jgi:predicted enzyme related to lactoylglutathione lyase
MKLYIFRCRARLQMYGATRYETASNLPTDRCSGGWEFHQRVDLSPRGTLHFLVDTGTVRRGVQQKGWHIWDESRVEPTKEVPRIDPPVLREKPRPATFETILPTESPAGHAEAVTESIPLAREHAQPAEPETIRSKESTAEPLKETPEGVPFPLPWKHRQPTESEIAEAEATLRAMFPRATTDRPPVRPVAPVASEVPVVPEKVEKSRDVPSPPAHHHVVWFDIPVRDIDRAVRFYSAVLGTPLKKEQAGPGVAIATLPRADGSIGGSLVQNMDAHPSESGPLLYLNAHSRLDEAVGVVEQYGGRVLAARHSIAPFGFRAIVLDSEGNRIALHSM